MHIIIEKGSGFASVKSQSMTLFDLAIDEYGQISKFSPLLDPTVISRMNELGIEIGSSVTCLFSPIGSAPRVYQTKFTILALETDVAKSIFLEQKI